MKQYVLALILAGAGRAAAQAPVPEQIVYEFKNVDVARAMSIANFVSNLMNGRVVISVDSTFKTAIIRPGARTPTADEMAHAETLVKRYDVPSPPPTPAPTADFVAYLVRAYTRVGPDDTPPPGGQSLPPALQEAVTEMKKTFNYTDFSLLDTVQTEVHEHAHVENMFPGVVAGTAAQREIHGVTPYFYEIDYGDTLLSADRKTVLVENFKFTVRIPVQSATNLQYQNSGITTNVRIREGQKLVLGKVRVGFNDPSDIFLVLTVRLKVTSPTALEWP